jgi:hypothetical protein
MGGRVPKLALPHPDDRFRKSSELVNHDQLADDFAQSQFLERPQ